MLPCSAQWFLQSTSTSLLFSVRMSGLSGGTADHCRGHRRLLKILVSHQTPEVDSSSLEQQENSNSVLLCKKLLYFNCSLIITARCFKATPNSELKMKVYSMFFVLDSSEGIEPLQGFYFCLSLLCGRFTLLC